MREEDYYPAGACHDPNAPYNQVDNTDTVDTDIEVVNVLIKLTTIPLKNVIIEPVLEEEVNDEGDVVTTQYNDYNYTNSDVYADYDEEEYSLIKLLDMLREYVETDLKANPNNKKHLEKVLKSLDGWRDDGLDINLA